MHTLRASHERESSFVYFSLLPFSLPLTADSLFWSRDRDKRERARARALTSFRQRRGAWNISRHYRARYVATVKHISACRKKEQIKKRKQGEIRSAESVKVQQSTPAARYLREVRHPACVRAHADTRDPKRILAMDEINVALFLVECRFASSREARALNPSLDSYRAHRPLIATIHRQLNLPWRLRVVPTRPHSPLRRHWLTEL